MSLKFLLVLKSFNGVSRLFKGCLKCKGCFKEVLRVFTESFKGISREFKGCFKEVSGKYQGCFKKVSRLFQLRLKDVSSNFKGVSRVFERRLCSKELGPKKFGKKI